MVSGASKSAPRPVVSTGRGPLHIVRVGTLEELREALTYAERVYNGVYVGRNFNKDVAAKHWASFIVSREGAIFCVADKEGKVLGVVCGFTNQCIDTGDTEAHVWHWKVDESASGYGVRLLWNFQKWAKAHGAKRIHLGCCAQLWTRGNETLFTRLGYTLEGVILSKRI